MKLEQHGAPNTVLPSCWPHRLAVILVCATFPLIWVGGLVTTSNAGMAVPDWPTTYGYNLLLYPWQTWILGPWDILVEHGHRLLGALTGILTLGLLATVWRFDKRFWMRLFASGLVLAVVGQGVLGGLRVLYDERSLALLHGCMAPAFLALCVAMVVFTSSEWTRGATNRPTATWQRLALITTLLAYGQLVLGAFIRHLPADSLPNAFRILVLFHLGLAAILVVHVVALLVRVASQSRDQRPVCRAAYGLACLTLLQILLGAGTWVVKYGWPWWLTDFGWVAAFTVQAGSLLQTHMVTAHVAIGSLILAMALWITLHSWQSGDEKNVLRPPVSSRIATPQGGALA